MVSEGRSWASFGKWAVMTWAIAGIAAGSLVIGHQDDELAVGKQLDGSETHGGANQLQRLLQGEGVSLSVGSPSGRKTDGSENCFRRKPPVTPPEQRPFMARG